MIKTKINKRAVINNVIIAVMGFLLSRVVLPGGIIPFGYGFFAAASDSNANSFTAGLAVSIGAVTMGFNARTVIVILSSLILTAFKVLSINISKKHGKIITIFVSGIIASLGAIAVNGFVLYDMLLAMAQNVISVVSYYIFKGLMKNISTKSGKFIMTEDLPQIAFSIILCVFGFPAIDVFGINLRNVVGIFLIILFAYKSSYGILAKLGKWGTCAGVVVLALSVAIMFGSSPQITEVLWDVIVADVIFFLIPEKLLTKIKISGASNINTVLDKANYADEMTSMVVGRLEGFSQGYSALAKSFSKLLRGADEIGESRRALVERAYIKACENCDMSEFCWKRTREETARAFNSLCETLEKYGKISTEETPKFFKEDCEKPETVLTEMKVGFEVERVEKIWMKRLSESKDVYAMQLSSLAAAAHNLAKEMKSDIKLMVKMSETLERELSKSGYKNVSASVIQNRFGKYEVNIDFKGKEKTEQAGGDRAVLRIVSNVLKQKMVDVGGMKFVEANRFKVSIGSSSISKIPGDVSGDSFTFINGGNGCFSAILCDGMGTGKKAREQSGLAVKLLENFSNNGFDNETAIEMINSALIMKTDEESYSTLDMVSINLQTGNTDFFKYGGMPTIIKYGLSEEEYSAQRQYLPAIETISSSSLPVGVVGKVSARTVRKKVCAGDCIIMMTDGVFDCFRIGGKSNGDLIRFIEDMEVKKPQLMAEEILSEASKLNSSSYKAASGESVSFEESEALPPDDMTVLVLEVEEDY